MLAVSVEFLHGTFRGDPDGTANTGRLTRGEWPPAPFRLFAALVAADGTRERCTVTDGAELEWFEQLPPPVIHAHAQPWHQPLNPRFVVRHKGTASKSTHQEYVGRAGVLHRPGVRVTPRYPHVVYSWNESPPEVTLDALRRRAARIGYLGAADSPVRVHVMTRMPEVAALEDAFIHALDGNMMINVPAPGDVRMLDRMYDAWYEHGADIGRAQFPALRHEAPYRSPRTVAQPDSGGVVAWLRLGTAVSGRRVAAVTALFKDAVLSKYQKIYGVPPAVLHGHGFGVSGYEIARFLALPDVGFHRSRGRIHGLALWMPPGSDAVERQRARDAAFAVRRLTGRGIDVSVVPREDEQRPVAAHPDRWCRRSYRWGTAFPAIHERRRPLELAEVARWCRHAGLPAPVAFRATRGPLVRGAVDLAPVEVNRPGKPGLPYSHVEIRFVEPVQGPVVIGAGRQRGFGLCVPVDVLAESEPAR